MQNETTTKKCNLIIANCVSFVFANDNKRAEIAVKVEQKSRLWQIFVENGLLLFVPGIEASNPHLM